MMMKKLRLPLLVVACMGWMYTFTGAYLTGFLTGTWDATACMASTSISSADEEPCIAGYANLASATGGGNVWLGGGIGNLKSQLILPKHVTLECAANARSFGDFSTVSYSTKGSILAVLWGNGTGNSNDPTKAAIQLRENTRLLNCAWWYPQQNTTASSPATSGPSGGSGEYGPTILVAGTGGSFNQEIAGNVCMECYNFIDGRGSVFGVGVAQLNIHDNGGGPIALGISLNFIEDYSTDRNNEFSVGQINGGLLSLTGSGGLCVTAGSCGLVSWAAQNGIAFYHGLIDWVNEDTNSAWGYQHCHYIDNATTFSGSGSVGGPLMVTATSCDATTYDFTVTTGEDESLNVIGGNVSAFCVAPLCGSSDVAGWTFNINAANTTMDSLQITGMQGIQAPMDAFVQAGNTGLTIKQFTAMNNHVWSTTSSSKYMFNIGNATDIILLGNIGHNFAGVNFAGSFTNSYINGNFNN